MTSCPVKAPSDLSPGLDRRQGTHATPSGMNKLVPITRSRTAASVSGKLIVPATIAAAEVRAPKHANHDKQRSRRLLGRGVRAFSVGFGARSNTAKMPDAIPPEVEHRSVRWGPGSGSASKPTAERTGRTRLLTPGHL